MLQCAWGCLVGSAALPSHHVITGDKSSAIVTGEVRFGGELVFQHKLMV